MIPIRMKIRIKKNKEEKPGKTSGISWVWWAFGAVVVVVIIGGILYYYWSEGENPANGGDSDKGNPPALPPKSNGNSPTPPKTTGDEPTNSGGETSSSSTNDVGKAVVAANAANGAKLVHTLTSTATNTSTPTNLTVEGEEGKVGEQGEGKVGEQGEGKVGEQGEGEVGDAINTANANRTSEDDDGPEVEHPADKPTDNFRFTEAEGDEIRATLLLVIEIYEKVSGQYQAFNEMEKASYNGVIINNRCMSLSKIKLLIELFITHLEQENDFVSKLEEYNNGCLEEDKLDDPGKGCSTDFIEDILRRIMVYLNRYATREKSKTLYPKVENFVEIGKQILERIKKVK